MICLPKRGHVMLALFLLMLAVSMRPASADAIDGTWCFKDGAIMSIQGSNITIPGGRHLQGNYSRHSYSYQVPEGEENAGGVVSMDLINDDTLHVTPPASTNVTLGSSVQTWRRCEVTS